MINIQSLLHKILLIGAGLSGTLVQKVIVCRDINQDIKVKKVLRFHKNRCKRPKKLIEELSEQGLNYYQKAMYQKALERHHNVLEKLDNHKKALEKVKLSNGDLLWPSYRFRTHINIAAAYMEQKNYPNAIKAYEKAKKLISQLKKQASNDHDIFQLYRYLGKAHYNQKQHKQAIKYYEKAKKYLQEDTNKLLLWQELGDIYLTQNRLKEAENYYRMALNQIANSDSEDLDAVRTTITKKLAIVNGIEGKDTTGTIISNIKANSYPLTYSTSLIGAMLGIVASSKLLKRESKDEEGENSSS